MDYSRESSTGQQNDIITVAPESHLALIREYMQFLSDQWDYLAEVMVRVDQAAVTKALELIVDAVITLRRLARHLGMELSDKAGQGWLECSRLDITRSLLSEVG